jgi:biopolymer transport protein ExbD
MAIKQAETDESGLNMTPMIDIVFQLIIFFMLNMRFRAKDHRIESVMPKDRGIQATPTLVDEIPSIKVSLFRLNQEDEAKAQTKIKINNQEWMVPVSVWTGAKDHDTALNAARDRTFASLQARIKELFTQNPKLKGEIEAPPPKGQAVPHGDIMSVLDSFIAAGLKEVNFGGAAAPLPKAKGGHGP